MSKILRHKCQSPSMEDMQLGKWRDETLTGVDTNQRKAKWNYMKLELLDDANAKHQ